MLLFFLLQSEKQLRNEIGMRHEILIAFEEQKSMIDALTTVINFLFFFYNSHLLIELLKSCDV